MNMNEFFKSPRFKSIIYLLALLLIALVIFQAGVFVGFRRATFSYQWDNNYVHDPRSVFAPFMHDSDEPNPHGTFGQVVSANYPEIMVKGPNTPEQIVILGPGTAIRRFHDAGTTTDLKAGTQVIVVGSPNEKGEIQASFVRIMPPLPGGATSTTLIK